MLPWVLVAFVLYLAVFLITVRVNVPLNDSLKAAGRVEATAARGRFDEALWARWNVFRALATTAAFGCLAWALVEFGRGI